MGPGASAEATGNGALGGIPFGVKDIIETRGLATEYGSPIYKGRIGTADAAIVRQLRQRGGVLLGKTHTTAFAYSTPAPRTTRATWRTRQAEVRAGPRRRSRPGWCLSRSEPRLEDPLCGRLPIAA